RADVLVHEHVADERHVLPLIIAECPISLKIAVGRNAVDCSRNHEVAVAIENSHSECDRELTDPSPRIGNCRRGCSKAYAADEDCCGQPATCSNGATVFHPICINL